MKTKIFYWFLLVLVMITIVPQFSGQHTFSDTLQINVLDSLVLNSRVNDNQKVIHQGDL